MTVFVVGGLVGLYHYVDSYWLYRRTIRVGVVEDTLRVLAFACTVLEATLLARAVPAERETGVLSPAPRPIPFD